MQVISRDDFIRDQADMGRLWYENFTKAGRNLDEYIASRCAAYLDRWRDAGRFIPPGSRVLDIGGGNSYAELLNYFKSQNWDYWYLDIGEAEVANSRQLAQSLGFDGSHFRRGLNHELNYDSDFFDAVFSSHCLEHSLDLKVTLAELNRILKTGGNLIFAVPIGWDEQPAHPYFLLVDHWLALLEDFGFHIRTFAVGCEYPEVGHDLMVVARKASAPKPVCRIDPERFRKPNYGFHSFEAAGIAYSGSATRHDGYMLMDGDDWRIAITLEAGLSEILPIFHSHCYSGVVRIGSNGAAIQPDLYMMNPTAQAVRLTLSAPSTAGQVVEIAPVGKNEASFAAQGVFAGYMAR